MKPMSIRRTGAAIAVHEESKNIEAHSVMLDTSTAVRLLREYVALKPTEPRGLTAMAIELTKQRRWADADAFYERSLAVRPDDALTLFGRAALYEAQQKWAHALPFARRSVEIEPLEVRRELFARLLLETGDLAGAERALRGWIARAPKESSMHCLLGIVLKKAGRTAEAVAAFEACSRLDPKNATARKALRLLRSAPAGSHHEVGGQAGDQDGGGALDGGAAGSDPAGSKPAGGGERIPEQHAPPSTKP